MFSRQQQRHLLRQIGTFIAKKFAVGAPRKVTRLTGRVYGNAAYRHLNLISYGDQNNGYMKFTPNCGVVSWIAREYERIDAEAKTVEVSTGGGDTAGIYAGSPQPDRDDVRSGSGSEQGERSSSGVDN